MTNGEILGRAIARHVYKKMIYKEFAGNEIEYILPKDITNPNLSIPFRKENDWKCLSKIDDRPWNYISFFKINRTILIFKNL
jgi:hypothetical protein